MDAYPEQGYNVCQSCGKLLFYAGTIIDLFGNEPEAVKFKKLTLLGVTEDDDGDDVQPVALCSERVLTQRRKGAERIF